MNTTISFKFSRLFTSLYLSMGLLLCLLLASSALTLQAQPCTIDLSGAGNIITPSGSTTICADALITLPTLPYTGGPTQIDPIVVWAIYSALPSNIDPGKDPALGASALLVDENGNAIINGGTADLSYAQLLAPDQASTFIVLVPVIVNQDFTFSECSGIDLTYSYPVFEILNPDFFPEICNPECIGGIYNDNCSDAYFINLFDLTPLADSTFTNVCATALNDPTLPEDCFADDDPYNATVWFSFNGNGGAYTIATLNCEGSTAEQLTNTQMAIYSGECGTLSSVPVACADNGNGSLYALIENFQTEAGQSYYVVVDGYNDAVGEFCLEITETIPPPQCTPDAGQTTLNVSTDTVCFGTSIVATVEGAVTDNYTTLIIAVDAGTNQIIASFPAGNLNLQPGSYSIYTLNYSNEDAALVAAATNTGQDFNDLLSALDMGTICGDIDNSVALLNILPPDHPDCLPCLPNAGTLAFEGGSTAENCLGQSISLIASGSAIDGYATYYILYNADFTVIAANESGDFSPTEAGNYTVFALNVAQADTPALLPLSSLIGLSQGQVQALLTDVAACYTESANPLPITILPAETVSCYCEATINLLDYTGINEFCLGLLSDSFTAIGENNSEGYVTALLIDYAGNGSNIDLITELGPINFGSLGLGSGTYNVYAVNYYEGFDNENQLLNLITEGTTIDQLTSTIETQQLCAALTPAVVFTMLPTDSPQCSCLPNPGSLNAEISGPICVGTPILLDIVGDNTDGYTSYYILIQNTDTTDNVVGYYTSSPIIINYDASYEIVVLNIANEDVPNMPTIVSPTEIDDFLAPLNSSESCYAINWPDALSVEVLSTFSPQCFDCQADVGTVTYPLGSQTLICPNSVAPPILVSDANATGYTTLFILTNAEGTVVGYDTNPSISFVGYSEGSYTAHVINYSNVFQPQILSLLAENLTWDNFLANVTDYCLVADTGSVIFTVVPAGTNNCLPPLSVCCISETISGDGLTYTITFTILGGSGNYIVDGIAITNSVYTSPSILCGTSYSFNITDDVNSGNIIVDGAAPCEEVCFTNAGTMPDLGGNVLICAGNMANFATSGAILNPSDVLLYILHDHSGTELGNVFAVNPVGEFYLGYNSSIQPNTVYYLSAVAGPTNALGGIIWDDNCTQVAAGVPVVFLNPIKVDIDGMCDWGVGEYWVTVNITGGLPEFANDVNYILSGDYNGTVSLGQNVTFSIAEAAANFYALSATDGVCSGDTSEIFVCTKTPVEWLSFEGQVLPEGNKLIWKTASETESDYFEVQYSTNGQSFETLGKVTAAGNSISAKKYEFLDRNAANGLTYYRIVQYDIDGQSSKSNTIDLLRTYERFNFTRIAPIPACDNLEITYNALSEAPVRMEIYNITGQLIESRALTAHNGLNTIGLSVDKYTSGIYLISLNDGSRIITNRFVVRH